MALKVTSLDQLDPDLVQQLQDEFSQLLAEKFPELETIRGPIHDVVHFLAGGVSGAINQTEINRVLQSASLQAIRENPELADPDIVDAVLSNLLIERQIGTSATGEITIVVQGSTSVVLSINQTFSANGMVFRLDEPIVAKPPGDEILDPGDRLLEPRGDGTYEFSVPATAEEIGEAGNIRRNLKLDPDPLFDRFVTAYATEDFAGGMATEDNAGLIARADEGVPAKVMQGRRNIVALLKSQAAFQNTKHYSIIGYGDPEMERDQHWIWPVSGGGRVDIYARTASQPQTFTVKKEAVLQEIQAGAQSVWQFSLGRNDVPGFYEVVQIRRPSDPTDVSGYNVIFDQRSYDLTDLDFAPDIVDAREAIYTRYQTAVIRFVDTDTDVSQMSVGDKKEYEIGVLGMPLIRQLQDFAVSDDYCNLMADVLVKACIPCFLSINLEIVKAASETAPDLLPIRQAIADYVNSLDFPGEIYLSSISDIVHDFLEGSQAIGFSELHGRIRRVDGSNAIIRDDQVLTIPDSPSTLVTPRTTAFILYPEDIGLSVRNRA